MKFNFLLGLLSTALISASTIVSANSPAKPQDLPKNIDMEKINQQILERLDQVRMQSLDDERRQVVLQQKAEQSFNEFKKKMNKMLLEQPKDFSFLPKDYNNTHYKGTFCFSQAGQYYNIDSTTLEALYHLEYGTQKRKVQEIYKNGIFNLTPTTLSQKLNLHPSWLEMFKKENMKINDLLEPCVAIHLGAFILNEERKKNPDEVVYIGRFSGHTKKAEQEKYYNKMKSIYNKIKQSEVK